jgi:hypothetical protein
VRSPPWNLHEARRDGFDRRPGCLYDCAHLAAKLHSGIVPMGYENL